MGHTQRERKEKGSSRSIQRQTHRKVNFENERTEGVKSQRKQTEKQTRAIHRYVKAHTNVPMYVNAWKDDI
jgi:hypothetical protein